MRLQPLERALFMAGAVCLIWYGAASADAYRVQRRERSTIDHALAFRMSSLARPGSPAPTFDAGIGRPIGVLEIPRLHLSVAVVNGDDDGTLRVAAGHLPDTPMPWERGNSAIAAHRDTFFRRLEDIQMNDEIRMMTPYGAFSYRVRHTLVVRPEDVWVLSPTPNQALTLVTCYPFWLVGHATRRFIVQADSVPLTE